MVVRSPDTIPRVNALEKLKLLSYFYQIFPKLSLNWNKPHFLPSIPKLIPHPRLSRGQSANAEWTPTAPEQHMQNSPMCFLSLWNEAIRVHGACLQDVNYTSQNMVCSSRMPGTSWELCVCSWIMLHPRWCFFFFLSLCGKKNGRKSKTN